MWKIKRVCLQPVRRGIRPGCKGLDEIKGLGSHCSRATRAAPRSPCRRSAPTDTGSNAADAAVRDMKGLIASGQARPTRQISIRPNTERGHQEKTTPSRNAPTQRAPGRELWSRPYSVRPTRAFPPACAEAVPVRVCPCRCGCFSLYALMSNLESVGRAADSPPIRRLRQARIVQAAHMTALSGSMPSKALFSAVPEGARQRPSDALAIIASLVDTFGVGT